MDKQAPVKSLTARRVPATEIRVGDEIALIGPVYFTVEWVREWAGSMYMAGIRSTGEAHVSQLSEGALVSKVFARS